MVVWNSWVVGAAAQPDDGPGWAASLVVAVTLLVAGGVLVWMGRRQAAGTLKRNGIAGYRTEATMASDAAWRAAHDATVRQTTWAGILTISGGLIFLTNPPLGLWLALAVGIPLAALAIVLWGAVVAQRAAKSVDERDA